MGDIGRKLPPQGFLFRGLIQNGLLLVPDVLHQWPKLRIGRRVQPVQIQGIDGPDNFLCRSEGEQRGNQQHQQHHPQHRAHSQKRIAHGAHRPGKPQDAAVVTDQRIVHGLAAAVFGFADTPALAGLQGGGNLGAVKLVPDGQGKYAVIQHLSLRGDPGDAVGLIQSFQIGLPAQHQTMLGINGLLLQGGVGFVQGLPVLQTEKQQTADQQHRQPQQEG